MNIFEKYLNKIKIIISNNLEELNIFELNHFKGVTVESPPPEFDFDLSCNICLILAKKNNMNPKYLAEKIKNLMLDNFKEIEKINVAGPGFLNIKLSSNAFINIINEIQKIKYNYGSLATNKKFNIEFVSANPTGPLHIGHCRGAIFGDVLSNLLKFNGNNIIKEYYINDYGNQITQFTKSVFLRIREIKYKEKFVPNKDLYPGEYIVDIAKKIIDDNPGIEFNNLEKEFSMLSKECLSISMQLIKSDLNKLGITHDVFFSETEIVNNNIVVKTIDKLKKDKLVVEGYLNPPKGEEIKNWKKMKRLIFKSTLFGDDEDRALQKNDGTWTYFANDIAYHSDKVSRKFDYLINVLGADHTGYIKRITAAVAAISNKSVKLHCKVCQLVKLYKNGEPFKMSKRAGDFISVSDLLNEVDKDSIRFMMLNRSNDVEIDFDFNKILEKNKDNPVFYVQYCFARINSLFRTVDKDLNDFIALDNLELKLNNYEVKILRKILEWPKIIETAAKKYEPHKIPYYLYDLATLFHSYWSKGNENDEFKFLDNGKIKNINTLVIIQLVALVIQNGMKILGVSLPSKM